MSDIEPQSPPEFSPELLAGYVLGDLSATEIAIVEAYLATHPNQQAEVAKLMLPLDLLSLTLPADNPPASLRSQILQQAGLETIGVAKPVEQFAVKSRRSRSSCRTRWVARPTSPRDWSLKDSPRSGRARR